MATRRAQPSTVLPLTALLVAACSVGNGSSPSASATAVSPSASASEEATPTPSPSPFAAATDFTSPTYGYTVTLPAGWTVYPATEKWDGTSAIGHDDPIVDQLLAPEVSGRCQTVFVCGPVLWAYAATTNQSLTDYVTARDAADAQDHACGPPRPERQERITIGGAQGLLETSHCPEDETGILILEAVTIHSGVAYSFFLQEPSHERAVEPADHSDLLALLKTVKLPA